MLCTVHIQTRSHLQVACNYKLALPSPSLPSLQLITNVLNYTLSDDATATTLISYNYDRTRTNEPTYFWLKLDHWDCVVHDTPL